MDNHVALAAESGRESLSSTAAHTPGPWIADDVRRDGDIDITVPSAIGRTAIVRAHDLWPRDGGKAVRDANARLIAAAPDLLEAMEKLLSHFERIPYRDPTGTRLNDTNPFIERAREAIAKASLDQTAGA